MTLTNLQNVPLISPSLLAIEKNTQKALQAAEPNHKPELDGIRGIALLAVLLSHAAPFIKVNGFFTRLLVYLMTPGWGGVELFFVLSGFLITGILLRTKSAQNYFSAFYMRRFLRIFPIYYLVLTVGIIVGRHNMWWNELLPHLLKTKIAYYFYMQNWPVFWPNRLFANPNIFGHFWSLAVEEQFYLVWPMVILLLPESMVFALCAGGFVLALPLRIWVVTLYHGDFTAFAMTSSRMDGLLVGVMLAILLSKRDIAIRWFLLMLAAGMSILVFIAVFHRHELIATYFYMPVYGVTAYALLSGALLGLSQQSIHWIKRVLTVGWLRDVGKYSYGMYIYHIPIYAIAGHCMFVYLNVQLPMSLHSAIPYTLLLICATFLAAKLSYDCFEAKFLVLKIYFKPKFGNAPV